MARKIKVTTREYDDEEREVPVEADPAEESYAAFMSKWGREGAKVRVYHVTPQGRQYCLLGTPEEIDPEYLRLYHARQPYAHEAGTYQVEIEVNGQVMPPFTILIAPQVGAPGAPDAGGMGGPMAEMFRMLQAQNERLERQLSQQNREPLSNIADALVKLDQLRGPQNQMSPEFMVKLIEMGRSSGAEPDWTMKLLDVLKDSMPAIQGVIASFTQQRNNGNGAPAGRIQEGPVNDEAAMLQMGLTYLKKKALAGSDPGLYVDMVVDNRDEPLYEKLIRRILETDFSAFATIDPEISKPEYEPFFRAFYDGVRSVFIPQNPVENDTGGKAGNAGNAPGDDKPRKGGGKK